MPMRKVAILALDRRGYWRQFLLSASRTMRELPITLPSLNVIVVRLPERMSDLDFTTFETTIKGWRDALVKPAKQVEPEDPDE